MFTGRSLHHRGVNDVIYDAECSHEGRYGCTPGPIWVHVSADMGSRERADMGCESRAVSVLETNHPVTIFSKTCNN